MNEIKINLNSISCLFVADIRKLVGTTLCKVREVGGKGLHCAMKMSVVLVGTVGSNQHVVAFP